MQPKAIDSNPIQSYSNHPLLESCLVSLIPYFDMVTLPENIASLKITEAISILRAIDPGIDSVLANFEKPGKIDLAGYMQKKFMFNLPLGKFGYLTTFKRDFSRAFGSTPQRWPTKKRLELAHYHLIENKKAD